MRKSIVLLTLFFIFTGIIINRSTAQSHVAQAATAVSQPQSTDDTSLVYLPIVHKPDNGFIPGSGGWPTVAANEQRTSWTQDEVSGMLRVEWYRPIEAYIPQNVQIIASNGFLFIATARGLYTLNAETGAVVWRYDTELPLGNSPTVADDVVYVGGYDRKIHALDAATGAHLWAFSEAKAGYSANPLVVDGKVIVGNRDGFMYAIGAHGTPNQGQLLWKFEAGGPIPMTAAYKNNVVYFAANDNYAYALNATTGQLIWKSNKLPGLQYQSYWPVIYQDKVIFSGALAYRSGLEPGTKSVLDDSGSPYTGFAQMNIEDVWPEQIEGTTIGPEVGARAWSNGYPVVDASRLTQFLEDNPNPDPDRHKPWRRVVAVLNMSNGREFTFDSDGDGYQEYAPVGWWGTGSGNRYPPLVGPGGNIMYVSNMYECCSDAKGRVTGWNIQSPSLLSVTGGFGALAEPQALSGGGDMIYRNLCCDRTGDFFSIAEQGMGAGGTLWSYNLDQLAPGYDEMWSIIPGLPRLQGWYWGQTGSMNAAYHNHGDQNPIIPYRGRVYVHRSNAIIAFGPETGPGKLPLLTASPAASSSVTPTQAELIARLEAEVDKMITAGHLRPGYYNQGQFSQYKELADYFENPGDTLYTLSWAYPYLAPQLQERLRGYLAQEFETYFNANMIASVGWLDGAQREGMVLPPEVDADRVNHPASTIATNASWFYPQHNFYGMWKYAQNVPGVDRGRVYDLAKSKLQVPVPAMAISETEYFRQRPYELNGYIAGYTGFLELQSLAGMAGTDAQLRTQVTDELNRLKQLRVNIFSKDSYWTADSRYHKKRLDIARNFIWLTPELGDYLNQTIRAQVQEAVAEYDTIAPYWFVSRYEGDIGESGTSTLYNYVALFQAKALILHEPQSELTKYLDAPAFVVGDLFYMQNLIAAIEAGN